MGLGHPSPSSLITEGCVSWEGGPGGPHQDPLSLARKGSESAGWHPHDFLHSWSRLSRKAVLSDHLWSPIKGYHLARARTGPAVGAGQFPKGHSVSEQRNGDHGIWKQERSIPLETPHPGKTGRAWEWWGTRNPRPCVYLRAMDRSFQ